MVASSVTRQPDLDDVAVVGQLAHAVPQQIRLELFARRRGVQERPIGPGIVAREPVEHGGHGGAVHHEVAGRPRAGTPGRGEKAEERGARRASPHVWR